MGINICDVNVKMNKTIWTLKIVEFNADEFKYSGL